MEPTAESPCLCFPEPIPSPSSSEGGWIRGHEGALCARIRRILERVGLRPDPELVAEILQDVYCRVLERRALRSWRGRSQAELLAYLGRIAERTVIDQIREANARKRAGAREVRVGRKRIEEIPDPRENPESDLLLAETERLFLRRCRDLPVRGPRGRNAWVARLALLEGWTSPEISRAAGGRIRPGYVACLVHRIRRRLRRDGLGPNRGRARSARAAGDPL